MPNSLSFETLQLHAGQVVETSQRARANPLYMSSSFVFEDSNHGAQLFAGEVSGNIYSRIGNPTVAVFEQRMAALEGGVAAVASSSGQAAQFMAISAICASGDNIVTTNALYGGSFNQFRHFFKRFNIEFKFVVGDEPADFEAAIDERTKGLYCESIGNPRCNVPDLPALASLAHKHKIPLIVDNTFGAGGFLVNPIAHGADIVVHSATKWISGSGTAIGGVVIDSGKFDWIGSGKFPSFTEPHEGFHGIRFAEQFGSSVFAVKVRLDVLRDLGSCLSPFNAWILCLGLETLSLRMERLCSNALALAEYLEAHENVAWVSYPGLKNHQYHAQALKLLRAGHFGGVLSFGLKGDPKLGSKVVDRFKLVSNVANVGDSKTLAIHPASTTHSQMSAKEQEVGAIRSDLIRVSVGTEGIVDILADFKQAIEAALEK